MIIMDLRIYIACVTAVSLLQGANAGCAQDIASNQGYTECMMGYSMYMQNAASSMDPNDPNAMMSIMCSTEGKAAMQCVMGYIKSCPDLMTAGDTATMFSSFKEFEKLGGFDAYCNMLGGPCQAVQQCLESTSQGMNEGSTPTPSHQTPFGVFQESIKSVCGPVKRMLECFKDVGDKCKDLENNIKYHVDKGRSDAPVGTTVPTYDEMKMFVKKECPKLPRDFATNTCVRNTLNSNAFVKCYENVTVTYPIQNNQVSCDAYRAGHKCVTMTIGKTCGTEYTDAFVKITPLFLAGIPSNCKLESSSVTGGSSILQMSTLSILVTMIPALRLR